MRVERFDGKELRLVLSAMVTDPVVLARIAPKWLPEGLFDSPWANLVGGWCVQHFQQYGQPPGSTLRSLFDSWAADKVAKGDEDTMAAVETFLTQTSKEYAKQAEKADSEYLTDVAQTYFNRVRLRRLGECIEYESNGKIDKPVEAVAGFKPIDLRGKTDYPLHEMDELLAGPYQKEEYLIARTLVAGQPCIVAGPEKSLKTLLMLDLAVSLVSGSDFLGHLEVCRPANVLLMSGESGLATLKKNLRIIYRERCGRFGRDRRISSLPKRLILSDRVPQIAEKAHLDKMRRLMEKLGTEVLVIDTASMALPGKDAANLMLMQGMLHGMSEVCRELPPSYYALPDCRVVLVGRDSAGKTNGRRRLRCRKFANASRRSCAVPAAATRPLGFAKNASGGWHAISSPSLIITMHIIAYMVPSSIRGNSPDSRIIQAQACGVRPENLPQQKLRKLVAPLHIHQRR